MSTSPILLVPAGSGGSRVTSVSSPLATSPGRSIAVPSAVLIAAVTL